MCNFQCQNYFELEQHSKKSLYGVTSAEVLRKKFLRKFLVIPLLYKFMFFNMVCCYLNDYSIF